MGQHSLFNAPEGDLESLGIKQVHLLEVDDPPQRFHVRDHLATDQVGVNDLTIGRILLDHAELPRAQDESLVTRKLSVKDALWGRVAGQNGGSAHVRLVRKSRVDVRAVAKREFIVFGPRPSASLPDLLLSRNFVHLEPQPAFFRDQQLPAHDLPFALGQRGPPVSRA